MEKISYHGKVLLFGFLGLFVGCCFAVIALVVNLLAETSALEEFGFGLGDLVLIYVLGGTVAGILAGMLHPLGRRLWGAILIGWLSFLPMAAGVMFLMAGPPANWDYDLVVSFVAAALPIGTGAAYVMWSEFVREGDNRHRE